MDPLFSVAPPPGDSLQQCPQVSPSESPIEWFGHPFEKLLEVSDAISDSLQIAKVVWRQGLSLQDGQVDFNLIEPAGVNRQRHRHGIGEFSAEPLGERGRAMRTALVHDPKDPSRRYVRFAVHDLSDEPIKGGDAIGVFDAPDDLGKVDVKCGEVRPSPAALVLVLDPLSSTIGVDFCGMEADSGLDTGLFVGRENEFIAPEMAALPDSLVEIQDWCCPLEEKWIPRPDPRSLSPRLQSISVEDSPDRRCADRLYVVLGQEDPLDVRDK